MKSPTMDERRAVARRLREYKCPVLSSQQTTREAVDAAVECMGLEDDEEMCTVRYFLDRLADLIDPGEGMDEDGRAALDWVREHGGLDEVEAEWGYAHDRTGLANSVAVRLGVDPLTDADISKKVMDELDRRLMPDSCEWPVFEDGFPVRIGDDFMDMHGRVHTVYAVKLKEGDRFTLIGTDCCRQTFPAGSRVGRPGAAPKVLDADGVEIRVGDRLYDTDTGCGRTVRAVNDNGTVEFDGHENRGWFGKFLTHRAPVLAADGKPLREVETVWDANGDGLQLTVVRVEGDRVVTTNARDGEQWWAAYILTHERPDSWERLEEDAGKEACEYFAHMTCGCETSEMLDETVEKCNAAKARDLVRRARALAERGER